MAQSKLDQLVRNTLAGMILLTLLLGMAGCAFNLIGRTISEARHPELAVQRRADEAAKRAAIERDVDEGRQREERRLKAEEARRAAHDEIMRGYAERARENENRCIRQMDYETCRRIYRPTSAEKAVDAAAIERAQRIAEAYRDQ